MLILSVILPIWHGIMHPLGHSVQSIGLAAVLHETSRSIGVIVAEKIKVSPAKRKQNTDDDTLV